MKHAPIIMKLFLIITFGLLATVSVHAADLFYMKNTTLYVMHDVDRGISESRELDTSVKNYVAEAGAVIYIKGSTLYLISDTREPKPISLASGVGDIKLKDGIIAYVESGSLRVRRVSEDVSVESRQVQDSTGVSSIDVAGRTIVFIKNVTTLYRVIDMDQGTSERVIYPVGDARVSAK